MYTCFLEFFTWPRSRSSYLGTFRRQFTMVARTWGPDRRLALEGCSSNTLEGTKTRSPGGSSYDSQGCVCRQQKKRVPHAASSRLQQNAKLLGHCQGKIINRTLRKIIGRHVCKPKKLLDNDRLFGETMAGPKKTQAARRVS